MAASDPGFVLLQPRPFAKRAGNLVLLPLLPHKPCPKALPAELWSKILHYVFMEYRQQGSRYTSWQQSLLLVCRTLKVRGDTALPLSVLTQIHYTSIRIPEPCSSYLL